MSGLCAAWATTMASIDQGDGFLLHSRPYRETSVISDFFLRHIGRVSVLFKGVRKRGRQGSRMRLLQPFIPLEIYYSGHHDLKNGRDLDALGPMIALTGVRLFSGLYVNELLMRLLHSEEPHERLFDGYHQSLVQLSSQPVEGALRQFEAILLEELGFGLLLTEDLDGRAVQTEEIYRYIPETGLQRVHGISNAETIRHDWFTGDALLAMSQAEYTCPETLKAAKRLHRMALAPLLGDKPLLSRSFFLQKSTRQM